MTFCDTLAGIEVRFGRTEPDGRTDGTGRMDKQTDGTTDGQTNVEVEIVI